MNIVSRPEFPQKILSLKLTNIFGEVKEGRVIRNNQKQQCLETTKLSGLQTLHTRFL